MVTSDPIADMLIRVKNGYLAGKSEVIVPWSKLLESLAKILVETGFLSKEKIVSEGAKTLVLELKYAGKIPALTQVKRVSKPSLRVYARKDGLPRVLGGLGMAIISTPRGLMTNKKARKEGLGGEVICEVW